MAERDPFGRDTREDPLAAMGWSDAPATAAESDAAAGRVVVEPPPDSSAVAVDLPGEPRPRRPPRASRTHRPPAVMRWLPRLLFAGAVIVVLVAIAVPVVDNVADELDDASTPSTPLPRDVEQPDRPTEPPRGLARGSMLLRGNLAPALKELRAQMGGRLRYVRIEAERVDVQVFKDGTLVSAQARWDREPQVFPASPSGTGGSTFNWSAVDASAPRRLVRGATGRAGKPSSAFNYAVLIDAAGLRWQAFLRDGTHFTAMPSGRILRQPG